MAVALQPTNVARCAVHELVHDMCTKRGPRGHGGRRPTRVTRGTSSMTNQFCKAPGTRGRVGVPARMMCLTSPCTLRGKCANSGTCVRREAVTLCVLLPPSPDTRKPQPCPRQKEQRIANSMPTRLICLCASVGWPHPLVEDRSGAQRGCPHVMRGPGAAVVVMDALNEEDSHEHAAEHGRGLVLNGAVRYLCPGG